MNKYLLIGLLMSFFSLQINAIEDCGLGSSQSDDCAPKAAPKPKPVIPKPQPEKKKPVKKKVQPQTEEVEEEEEEEETTAPIKVEKATPVVPTKPVETKYTLTVDADVVGAEVFIGNQLIGKTPLNIQLTPAQYGLVIKYNGKQLNQVADMRKNHFQVEVSFNKPIAIKPVKQFSKENFGKRFALVIGNQNYLTNSFTNLSSPHKDAGDIAHFLSQKAGFEVLLLKDGTKRAMDNALQIFKQTLKENPESIALFYFSGHGFSSSETDFIVPSDASNNIKDSLSIITILDLLTSNVKGNIIFLDSSRYDPTLETKRVRKGMKGAKNIRTEPEFVPMIRPILKNCLMGFASRRYEIANDGEDKEHNGIFTEALLRNLKKPDLTLLEIMDNVHVEVVKFNQYPAYDLCESTNDFIETFRFIPK